MSDEDIKDFIDYFGEDNIPSPENYPRKFAWLMRWYKVVVRNRENG
tara:strand:+ start:1304 stop:1441 length:138 start_codon:yes stop_codon:yes gene_type:complete